MAKHTSFFTYAFFFFFLGFLTVQFSHLQPSVHRGVASESEMVKPWYDASWKL